MESHCWPPVGETAREAPEFHTGTPPTQVWRTRKASSSTTRSAVGAQPQGGPGRGGRARRPGVVAVSCAAADDAEADVARQPAEHAVHGGHAAGQRAVGQLGPAARARESVCSPRRAVAPTRQAGAGRGVGDGDDAGAALRLHGQPHHRRHARGEPSPITSQVTSGPASSTRAGQARRAMRQRRHAVEQVRGVARPGGNRRHALLVGGRRMPERHAVAGPGQPPHQVEAAGQVPARASRCARPRDARRWRPGWRRR